MTLNFEYVYHRLIHLLESLLILSFLLRWPIGAKRRPPVCRWRMSTTFWILHWQLGVSLVSWAVQGIYILKKLSGWILLEKLVPLGWINGLDGEVAFEKRDTIHAHHKFISLLHYLPAVLHWGGRIALLSVRCEKVLIIFYRRIVAVSIDGLVRSLH